MALREILAAFGFEVDDSALKKGNEAANAFQNTIKGLGRAIGGGALVSAFKDMVMGSLDAAGHLNDLSERLGISTRDLQFFQYYGGLAGVSAEQMAQSMNLLNRQLGEAKGGGEAAKAFTSLGVKIKDANGQLRNGTDLLPEIADKIAGLKTQAEKTAAATQIFGKQGAALLPLFKDGAKGIEDAKKTFEELGLAIDDDFIKSADDAGDQIATFQIQMDVLKTKLVGAALPAIKDITDFLLKMGKGAMDLAKNTNIVKIAIAALTALAAGAAIAAINGLLQSLGLLDAEMSILDAEVALPIAALLLLALVVEDLYTLFTGGDSVIGRFIDSLFGVGASKKFVEEVTRQAEKLWEAFKQLGPPLEELGRMIADVFGEDGGAGIAILKFAVNGFALGLQVLAVVLRVVIGLVSGLIGYAKFLFTTVSAEVQGAAATFKFFGGLLDTFVIKPFQFIIGLAEKVASAISRVTGGAQALSGVAGGQGGFLSNAASLAKSAVGGGSSQAANVSQQNQTTIHVNGSDQPQSVAAKVANAVADTFETQKRNAFNAVGSLFS